MTKDEFTFWKANPVTKEVLKYLANVRDNYLIETLELGTACNEMERVALTTARNGGYARAVTDLLDMEWEDFLDEETSE